jgi:hypothetical protein
MNRNQMKTEKEILLKYLYECCCGKIYTKRGLAAPDCAWCNNVDYVIMAMQEYAEQEVKKANIEMLEEIIKELKAETK